MRLHRLALVMPLILLLAAAGCGGSDAPSRSEYANNIDRLCAQQKKKFENVEEPKSIREIPRFADDIQKTFNETATKLEDIERPEGKAGEEARSFVESFQSDVNKQVTPKLDNIKRAARSGEQDRVLEAVQELQQIETPRTDRLAQDLGASECGGSA